jgi:hypothetical protein
MAESSIVAVVFQDLADAYAELSSGSTSPKAVRRSFANDQVRKSRAWRCDYLDQTLRALGFETARVESFGLRRIPAPPQERVSQVA